MMVELPVDVEDWVEIVRVVEQFGVHDVGENEAVAPIGKPEADKLSEAGVPVVRLAMIALVVLFP